MAASTGRAFGRDKRVNEERKSPSIIELYLISEGTLGDVLEMAVVNQKQRWLQ